MNNDLISRIALLRNIDGYGISIDPYNITRLITQKILAAPAVDAVEVVRCKDCEEYIPWLEGDYICGRIGSYFGNTKPNDFCSRGVRKTDMEVTDDQM